MIYEEIKNWDEDVEAYGVSPPVVRCTELRKIKNILRLLKE